MARIVNVRFTLITNTVFMLKPILFSLLLIIAVAGCAAGGATPTPTIVPLERTATAQRIAAVTADAPPTATSIPLPSPTPTLTPWPGATVPAAQQVVPPTLETPDLQVSPTIEAQPQVEIISYALNVRQGPGVDYPKLGTAQAGDVFAVTGRHAGGNWLQIEFRGESGWVSSQPQYTRLLNGDAVAGNLPAQPAPTLVANAVTAAQPVASQAGGRLIFATRSGGDLYAVNIDGSDLRLLAGGVIDPAVSPDGTQVAFTRWDGAKFGALYLLNLETGREQVVVGDIRQPKSPTWSPDGQKIVISFQHGGRRNPKFTCRFFDFDDGISLPDNIVISSVDVHDDGTVRICYTPNEILKWYLREINVADGRFEDLASDEYAYSPTWDPQNDWRVVYSGNRGLMQYDVNTSEQWPLSTDLRDTEPVFSPDGSQLAVTYKQHDHWEVYTLNLAGGERQRLTKPPILAEPQFSSAAPAWSPDGTQLAFVTNRTGRWEIWKMAADGSNPQPLFSPEVQAQLNLQYNGVNERLLNWLE